MEANEKEISPAEQEGRILLESRILMDLPDIEDTQWKYHPLRKEHSCCFSKGHKSRAIVFSCETLKNICENPDSIENTVKETIAELKRRII